MGAENCRGGVDFYEKWKNRKKWKFSGANTGKSIKNGFLSGGHFFDDFHDNENLGVELERRGP